MNHLIVDIIIPSLQLDDSEKYTGFIEALERSEDTTHQIKAKYLSKLISKTYYYVRTYENITNHIVSVIIMC